MKRVYDSGLVDNNPISIAVDVVTVGVAYTAAYLVRSGGQFSLITDSNAAANNVGLQKPNGDILNFTIGLASQVRKSYVTFRTLIDLSHLAEDERKREVELIRVDYSFFGGFSGEQEYNFDKDDIIASPDNKFISISKPVEML